MSSQPDTGPDGRPYRVYMCVVCGFIYKEVEGWPQDGILPGTRWDDNPWVVAITFDVVQQNIDRIDA